MTDTYSIIRRYLTALAYTGIALIWIVTGLIARDSMDITTHDTYYVIPTSVIWFALSLLYFCFGGLSALFTGLRRPLPTGLIWPHFFLTTIALFWMILLPTFYHPPRFTDYSVLEDLNSAQPVRDITTQISIVAALALLAQFLLVSGIIVAVARKKR